VRWALCSLLLAALVPMAAQSAPVGYTVNSGGIVDATGCVSLACPLAADVTLDDAPGTKSMTGSITLDAVANTLSFSLTLGAVTLIETVLASTEDNGVAQVTFSNATYTATNVAVINAAPTFIFNGTGTITGTITHLDDASAAVNGTPSGFVLNNVALSGTCTDLGGGSLSCAPNFGRSGFVLGVGDPDGGKPALDRYFRHSAMVTAIVPEPSVGLLVGGGLLVLGLVRRVQRGN